MNVYSQGILRSTSVTIGGSLMILALQGCVMNRGSAVNESVSGQIPQASGPATRWREEFEGGSQAVTRQRGFTEL